MTSVHSKKPKLHAGRFQFTFRTLLVAVVAVLLAALFSWIGVHVQRCRHDYRAAQVIEKLGGQVQVEPVGPQWVRGILGEGYLERVVGVSFVDVPLTDTELAQLQSLTGVKELNLSHTGIGDADLAELRHLSNLRVLYLVDTPVTDGGLVHLEGLPNLRAVDLSSTRVTDAGLTHLSALPGLVCLGLDRTGVTDEGLHQLEDLPNLRVLSLQETKVTERGVAHLKDALPDLQVVRRPEDPVQIEERWFD